VAAIQFLGLGVVAASVFVLAFFLALGRDVDHEKEWRLSSAPAATVLVPAYNEEHVVESSLENLVSLDYPNLQVVFVDDGSMDSTLEVAEGFSSEGVSVVGLDENMGKAAALNRGLEEVDTEYVAVQDADSVVDGEALEKALARMEAQEDLGAVIARIKGLRKNSFVRRLQSVEYTVTNYVRSLLSEINTLDCTPGAFSLYRTEDVVSVGGFDEDNPTEDLELAWRLRKNGRDLAMVYGATSRTEFPGSMSSLYEQRVRWARGWIHNILKHRDMLFNSEHGWFGRMQLPLNLLVPVLALIGFTMAVFGWLEAVYEFALTAPITGLELSVEPELSTLLGAQWKVFVPLSANLGLSGALLYSSYSKSDKKAREIPALLFFFFAFFFVKGVFWTAAVIKHAAGAELSWT